jgi:hypothetical protein
MRLGAAAAVALALALAGCGADYVEQNHSSVLLIVESVNGGTPLLSDVNNDGIVVNCLGTVSASVRAKNPSNPVTPVNDVRLLRYEVSYRRSDGRGVPGVDVPYAISGNLTYTIPAGGGVAEFTVDLVRHQAKLVPPLSNITGVQVVTMFADVTITGQTIAQQTVSGQGSVQITFADFATGTTTCESGS